MHRRLLPFVVLTAALMAPSAARADWGIRGAYLVPMYSNVGSATPDGKTQYSVGDVWLSNLDFILSWYPISFLSIDLEGQFNLNSTNANYPFNGIYVGPGVTLDLPLFLYGRASIPIQVSGASTATISTPTTFLRLAGGLKLQLFVVTLYLEVGVDLAMFGSGISFFGSQTVNVAAGLWVKF
jgi:hypothetical protein